MFRVLIALGGVLTLPQFVEAQVPGPASNVPEDYEVRIQRTQLRHMAVNSLLSGTAAGLAAVLRDDPFLPAFGTGMGGGAVSFAGKRLAAASWPGAGLLGRQLNSVGASITGNAVAGRGSLDRVALSVGPVRVWFGTDVGGVAVRVDAPALGAAIYTAAAGAEIDLNASLSCGCLVFTGDRNYGLPGTISVEPPLDPLSRELGLAHEQIHVLQYDQSYLSLGAPLEDWVSERFSRAGRPLRYVELNAVPLAVGGALGSWVWDYSSRPWEVEAFFLQWFSQDLR